IMSYDGGEELVRLCGERGFSGIFLEYLKARLTGRAELHPYLTWALLGTRLFRPSAKEWMRMSEELRGGEREVAAFLRNRVLVLPVYHCAAPEHGKVYAELFSIRKTFLRYLPYVAYANTFGLPSLTVPVGTDRSGMPIGLQLITAVGQEAALFQWGRRVEAAFRGYVRCTKYDAESGDEPGGGS
ncbi:MAG: amidase family protein, partial [Planifilum fulgidum]